MVCATILACFFIGKTQTATPLIQGNMLRAQELQHERTKWSQGQTRTHAHSGDRQQKYRDEALRTLSLLDELYTNEQQLWTYYDAIEQRQRIEQQHIRDRVTLEKNIQQQQNELSNLNKTIIQLRPLQHTQYTRHKKDINFLKPSHP